MRARRAAFLAIALAVHAAAVASGIAWAALQEEPLPTPYVYRFRPCIFLDSLVTFDARPLFLGASAAEVEALLGGRTIGPAITGRATPLCVRYEYGSASAVTVLFQNGRVKNVWFKDQSRAAPTCSGDLLHVRVSEG